MKTFLKRFLLGLVAAASGVAVAFTGVAYVAYVGYNPVTNQVGQPGVTVNTGPIPTLDATTSCGTTATVQASGLGGAAAFQFSANSAGGTCTLVVDFPTQAPNGYFCVAVDETNAAKVFTQTAHTTSTCTVSAATVASSDKVLIEVNGF
jgi:hypothetical protein